MVIHAIHRHAQKTSANIVRCEQITQRDILPGGLSNEGVTHNEDLPPLANRGLLCEDDGTESL